MQNPKEAGSAQTGQNKQTQRYFENIVENGKLEILPVLCSPKPYGEVGKGLPVAIVDRGILESMLEEIAKGYRESARSKISFL